MRAQHVFPTTASAFVRAVEGAPDAGSDAPEVFIYTLILSGPLGVIAAFPSRKFMWFRW